MVNKCFLLGRLGQDPELRYTQSQIAVCTLNVATNERRKGADGEWTDHTEWHRVIVWNKQAENCNNYLSKGRQVFIEGKIQTRKWQDQNGQDKYTTEIVANSVQFIGGKADGEISQGYNNSSMPNQGNIDTMASNAKNELADDIGIDDDDIPF